MPTSRSQVLYRQNCKKYFITAARRSPITYSTGSALYSYSSTIPHYSYTPRQHSLSNTPVRHLENPSRVPSEKQSKPKSWRLYTHLCIPRRQNQDLTTTVVQYPVVSHSIENDAYCNFIEHLFAPQRREVAAFATETLKDSENEQRTQ